MPELAVRGHKFAANEEEIDACRCNTLKLCV